MLKIEIPVSTSDQRLSPDREQLVERLCSPGKKSPEFLRKRCQAAALHKRLLLQVRSLV